MCYAPKYPSDDNAPPMHYNRYARQYESEQTREDITRYCRRFDLVQWTCTEVTFEMSRDEFRFKGNWYKIKVTFYFLSCAWERTRQIFYTNQVI